MKTAFVEKQKRRLVEMRGRLGTEINRMIEAMREEAVPPGEHERYGAPSESVEKEIHLEHNEESIREAVIAAIDRIEHNRYGTCKGCGRRIPQARLNAIPYAERCFDCEEDLQRD
jgi:RNA polymerase-binding transcription factor DksA